VLLSFTLSIAWDSVVTSGVGDPPKIAQDVVASYQTQLSNRLAVWSVYSCLVGIDTATPGARLLRVCQTD
jgi:hypothetical protein